MSGSTRSPMRMRSSIPAAAGRRALDAVIREGLSGCGATERSNLSLQDPSCGSTARRQSCSRSPCTSFAPTHSNMARSPPRTAASTSNGRFPPVIPMRFDFSWSERGGPKIAPPDRTGFGTRILKRGLELETGGAAGCGASTLPDCDMALPTRVTRASPSPTQRLVQSLELDRGIAAVIRTDPHEAPDRHRRSFDRSPLVARTRHMRRDGATDRLATSNRLPARLPAGFFVYGELHVPVIVHFEASAVRRTRRRDDIAEQAIARLLDGNDLDRSMARELFARKSSRATLANR